MIAKGLHWLSLGAPLWVFAACDITERVVEERSEVAGAPDRVGSEDNIGGAGSAAASAPNAPGSMCRSDTDCASGICDGWIPIGMSTGFEGYCTVGMLGSGCNQNADCIQGSCEVADPTLALGHCVRGHAGAPCASDDDCDATECTTSRICSSGLPGDSCTTDSQCVRGICLHILTTGEAGASALTPAGVCGSDILYPGAVCDEDKHCFGGNCVFGANNIGHCELIAEAGSAGEGGTSATNGGTGGI